MSRRTGYVWHERFAWHDTGTHAGIVPAGSFVQPHLTFESSESKSRMAGLIEVSGLLDQLVRLTAVPASYEQAKLVHTPEYLERLRILSANGGGDGGDGFTPFGAGSYEIAMLAAGGTITATRAVLSGEVDNAYALVRPPGHHAVPDQGMGYCLLSNVSIAVQEARQSMGIERVMIIDYDVHHGNGAQTIFWDDPDVLTVSIHQQGLFPLVGGEVEETGGAGAEGTCINVPLPGGSGNGAYLAAIERVAVPAAHKFKPELILVSSGFDPSPLDPLGGMTVTSEGFRAIATMLVDAADDICGGRIVFSHEGGYSPVHVPFCGLAVIEALSGLRTDVVDPFGPSFDSSPAHPLQPWQDDVISRAEAVMTRLGGW